MLSCVPEAMFEYKSLIDRGHDLALGDAMTYEAELSRRHASPPPEVVAERRLKVQQRGRRKWPGPRRGRGLVPACAELIAPSAPVSLSGIPRNKGMLVSRVVTQPWSR